MGALIRKASHPTIARNTNFRRASLGKAVFGCYVEYGCRFGRDPEFPAIMDPCNSRVQFDFIRLEHQNLNCLW